jgi:hypothetical protein
MTMPPLPAQGATAWYDWAQGVHDRVVDASTTVKGIVELATTTEATGTDAVRALTPAAASAAFVSQTNAIDLESTQDSIASMFTSGTHSGVVFVYDDAGAVINATVTPGGVADASTTVKGIVQLAGDLAGTATTPLVPGLAAKAPKAAIANTQTGTTYTLIVSDVRKVVEMNNAAANILTVPPNIFVAGDVVDLYQHGAGQTTVTAGSGLTLRAPAGAKLAAQYASARLRFRSATEAVLSGNTVV